MQWLFHGFTSELLRQSEVVVVVIIIIAKKSIMESGVQDYIEEQSPAKCWQ